MAWLNTIELRKKYQDKDFREAFNELYKLRLFFKEALVPSDYKAPRRLRDAISLTEQGQLWLSRILNGVIDITQDEAKVALFIKLFHQELFVDPAETKSEVIKAVLDSEILGERIRYPWIHDRLLYDRFFDMFPSQTRELSYVETLKLLENTPQGVFQVRDSVVGPFGVLDSLGHRFMPPVRRAPLWHCSDPSCFAEHLVLFATGESKIAEAVNYITNQCEKAEGRCSEWDGFFEHIKFEKVQYYDDMYLWTLPCLLINAFSEREIRSILKELIDRNSEEIRQRFPKSTRFKDILSGTSENISRRLKRAQSFQLILLMLDESIVQCVEYLIENRIINIPATETRTSGPMQIRDGWLGTTCECSRFGVRSVSPEIALARLKRLIKQTCVKEKDSEDLEWKLRYVAGETMYEKLDNYVYAQDPKRIVRDLVLSNPTHIQQAFQLLRYGQFELPSTPEEEDRLVEKILWKLGFNVRLYPTHQHLFWKRIDKFLETVRNCGTYNEYDKELIRSSGVNFFVSLEEILDYSLSFTTWALLSDHYGKTKFRCNFDEARNFMASRLNGLRWGSNEPLEFDPAAKNTLYPLIQGFRLLADLCNTILDSTLTDET